MIQFRRVTATRETVELAGNMMCLSNNADLTRDEIIGAHSIVIAAALFNWFPPERHDKIITEIADLIRYNLAALQSGDKPQS